MEVSHERDVGRQPGTPTGATWWTHKEVCAHLRVDTRIVLARMKETPDHVDRPWINCGTLKKAFYRWKADGVDKWWIEVNDWRTTAPSRAASRRSSVGPLQDRPGGAKHGRAQQRPGTEYPSLAAYVRSLLAERKTDEESGSRLPPGKRR